MEKSFRKLQNASDMAVLIIVPAIFIVAGAGAMAAEIMNNGFTLNCLLGLIPMAIGGGVLYIVIGGFKKRQKLMKEGILVNGIISEIYRSRKKSGL